MKPNVFLLLLSVLLLASTACRRSDQAPVTEPQPDTTRHIAESDYKTDAVLIADPGGADRDLVVRDEIRRSYQFKPGKNLEISRINGSVDIQTADIDHAEILIVRSAKTREDMEYRQVRIENSEETLTIYVESDRRSIFSSIGRLPEGRQRVILKIPARASIEVHGVNGPLTIGEVTGKVQVSGTNGEVKIAAISGGLESRGINGELTASFRKLGPEGIEISGYNGGVNLKFAGPLNANLEMRGTTGEFINEVPDFKPDEEAGRRRMTKGIFGEGGPEIVIRGGNGNVRITSESKPAGHK